MKFILSFLLGFSFSFWWIQRFGLLRTIRTGENWSISVLRGKSIGDLSEQSRQTPACFTALNVHDIPALFVADPFMVQEASKWHMFFEAMNAQSRRGEIGLATSDDAKSWRYEKIVLKEPFHLSFPYVFQSEGRYYMIPETFETGEIRLYEAVKFPYEWKYVQPLVTGKDFVDSVIFYEQNHFWLWTSTTDNKNSYLYFSEKLPGPWKEHPKSPVIKNDAASARPAGRVVMIDGRRIRFAQVDEPDYGMKVRAFEITELSETEYQEKECSFSPVLQGSGKGWNADRMHHIDLQRFKEEWIALVDGYRELSRQESFLIWVCAALKDVLIRLDRRLRSRSSCVE